MTKFQNSLVATCCRKVPILLTFSFLVAGSLFSEASAADDKTKTVRGLDGAEVTIKDPVERIVTIPMPSASMFVSIDGSSERLIGMHERSKEALVQGVLGDFYPKAVDIASDITKEGFIPNIENIMRLYPDVVVQWETMPKTFKTMQDAGLNVASFIKYNNEEKAYQNLRLVAQILGKEDKQEELISWRKETESLVREKAKKIDEADKKSIVWILYHKKGLTVSGGGTYTEFFFELAGGKFAASELNGWPKIDMEQMLQWDPDVIVIGNFDPLVPSDVYADPQFSNMKAVKNKRVYKMPLGGYRWGPANQESPLAWMWSYNILNPDKDPFDLREAIKTQYDFIYGKTPSEEQIDEILHLDLNSNSADYAQFARKQGSL